MPLEPAVPLLQPKNVKKLLNIPEKDDLVHVSNSKGSRGKNIQTAQKV